MVGWWSSKLPKFVQMFGTRLVVSVHTQRAPTRASLYAPPRGTAGRLLVLSVHLIYLCRAKSICEKESSGSASAHGPGHSAM